MQYRFLLINRIDNSSLPFKTMKDVSEHLNLPYHQARSLFLSSDKLYLHPKTQELSKKYDLKIFPNSV
jgi:hypothetical protein